MFRKVLWYGGMLLLSTAMALVMPRVGWSRGGGGGGGGGGFGGGHMGGGGFGGGHMGGGFGGGYYGGAQFGGPRYGRGPASGYNDEFNHGFDGSSDHDRFRPGVGYFGYDPDLYDYYGYPYAFSGPTYDSEYYGSDESNTAYDSNMIASPAQVYRPTTGHT